MHGVSILTKVELKSSPSIWRISTTMKPIPTRDGAQIEALVRAFEECSLSAAEFDHHAHMTVALVYLDRLPSSEAFACMRERIQVFAAHHGQTALYHETITRFWMIVLRHALDQEATSRPFPDRVHDILATWGNTSVLFRHYTKERVLSDQAKRSWIEPDLLPLPGDG